jgi:putative FmdB family regulatory protein
MPLFDFSCRSCGKQSELLIRGSATPTCPHCKSTDLDKLLSLPTVKSESTKQNALKAAKARDAKQGAERIYTQREYEKNHD